MKSRVHLRARGTNEAFTGSLMLLTVFEWSHMCVSADDTMPL